MKNKRIYNVLFLLALVLFSSCEDELQILPEDNVSPEVALSTPTTILGLVNGLYSQAQAADAFNGTPQTSAEFQADNSIFRGSFPTLRAIRDYDTQADNTSINAIWFQNSDVIEATNFVINNLPAVEIPGFSEDLKTQYIAEARFLRALTMFNMSKYFGQPYQVAQGASLSIPIILQDFRGDNVEDFQGPRNTLNEVYAQVDDDLQFAMANLPETHGANSETRGRATSGAAKALKARLELYRDNWPAAAQLADEVINSSVYELASNYDFYGDALTSEDIFAIINSAIDGQGAIGYSDLTNPTPGGRGDAPFSDNLIAAYGEEPGDLRFTELTQVGIDAEGFESVFTSKFPEPAGNSDNARIIRVTEMYLIRAEANLKASSTVGATPLEDINTLRSRAGLSALTTVTIDNILTERRKELAFEEGHRRMDLLRNSRDLRRPGMENIAQSAFGGPLTIFPIPTRELDLNPALEQNPGY